MAKSGGAKNVGKAEVTVEFKADEESLAALGEAVQSATGKTASAAGTPKSASAATTAKTTVQAEASVKVKAGVAKQVEAAIKGQTYEITIDVKNLREQITAALKAPFQITVDANVEGKQGAASAHQAAPVLQQAQQRGPVPERLTGYVNKFGQDIDNLHARLREAGEAMGKTFGKLGSSGSSLDRAIEILQTFGASDFKGLLTLTQNNGKLPKATGGRLSAQSLTEAGYDPAHARSIENAARGFTSMNDKGEMRQSDAMALFKNLAQYIAQQPPTPQAPEPQPQPQAQQKQAAAAATPAPAAAQAMQELGAATKQLRKVLSVIPTQAVTPENLMQKYAVDRTPRRGGVVKSVGEEVARAVEPMVTIFEKMYSDTGVHSNTAIHGQVPASQLEAAIAQLVAGGANPENIYSNPVAGGSVGKGRTGTRARVAGAPRPDEDPEATARSVGQLGTRNNPRAMLGGFVPREINGHQVDIEPLLQAARAGEFQGLIQTQKGEVRRFAPGTEEEAARARAASTGNRPFRINDVEGQVTNIKPSDAFWDAVSKTFDEEIAGQLKLDPEVQNLARGSLRQGAAPRPLVDPGPPQPGSGEKGGIVSGSGHGFENSYRAAYRLVDTLKQIKTVSGEIDRRWEHVNKLWDEGKDATGLIGAIREREERLASLELRAKKLAQIADPAAHPQLAAMAGVSPEARALTAAAAKVRNARVAEESGGRYLNESQRVVGEGRGLSDEEIAKNVVEQKKRAAAKKMGMGDLQGQIESQVLAKWQDPNFLGYRGEEIEKAKSRRSTITQANKAGTLSDKDYNDEYETLTERIRSLESGGDTGRAENSMSALSRAFREVTATIEKPEKGPQKAIVDKAIGDARRSLLGERDRVMKGVGDTAYGSEERRGGLFGTIEREQAEAAANRADQGRGRGRVYKTLGDSATGASSASGVAERRAEPMRPATSLDTERQTLMAKYEAEARKIASERASNISDKQMKERGFESRDELIRSELMSPPIRRRDGSTVPAQIKSAIRGDVEKTTDVGQRVAEIRKIQKAADDLLKGIAGKTDDITEQRSMVEGTKRIGSRGSADFTSAVKAEALEVLQSRTAGHARDPYGRETKDPVSGDETRAAYRKGGGIAAGEPLSGPAAAKSGAWMAKDVASPAGTFHVIIAGQTAPVQVTMAAGGGGGGASGGGGGGGRGRGGGKPPEKPEEPMGPQHGPDDPRFVSAGQTGTLFAAQEKFDKQYAARDPLGTRKRPAMRAKTTAEEIGRRRMAREEAAAQEAAAKEAERPFKGFHEEALANERVKAREEREKRQAASAQARMVRESKRLSRTADPEGIGRERDISDDEFESIRAKNRGVQRSVPRRGFGASLTDLVTARTGGGAFEQQLEAADRAQREANELTQYGQRRADLRTQKSGFVKQARAANVDLLAARASGDTEGEEKARLRKTSAIDSARTVDKELTGLGKAIDISKAKFFENANAATKASTVLKSFGAAAVGSVVSTGIGALTVGLGMAVAAPLIQGVGEGVSAALGPIIERMSGFAGTTGRVQGEVATGIRASGDDVRSALAQQGTAARLTDEQLALIAGPLGQRGTNVAGAQNASQQFDLLNTSRNVEAQRQGGFDRSLFRSTGGLFDFQGSGPLSDISIGGQASVAETLAGQLKNIVNPDTIAKQAETLPSIQDTFGIGDSFATRQANDQAKANAIMADNNKQLGFLNANLKGSKFKLVQGGTPESLDAQRDLFAAAGSQSLGEALADAKLTVQGIDPSGKPFEEIGSFLKTFVGGQELSPKQILDQDSRAIQAQIQGEDANRKFQTGTVNPQTFALSEAQHPLGPANAGISTAGLSASQAKAVNTELAQTQKLYDGINKEVDTGIDQAKQFVSQTFAYDPKVGQDFAKSLDHVVDLGHQITQIEVGVQTKQAAYSAHQFENSIFMANRALKDAKGLVTGIGDSMGAIERQIFNLQRQSQSLSMGMTQRQINFQTAIAGFQAPGLTSEERQARMEEAKLEAAYAQKQLDIQKQLFGLQGRQFNKGASRQVGDLQRSLALLKEGREVSVSTAVAEKKILALSKIQAKENKQVETYYQAAVQRTGDVMAEEQKLVAATGKAMADVGRIVLTEFKNAYVGYTKVIQGGIPNSSGSPDDRNDSKSSSSGGHFAAGFLGTVSGTTSLGKFGVVGESAGEAVAIVKSPQQLASPMGGGGGVMNFTVVINNPVVKSDDDKRKLIADVKRALQQEASLLLPRRA